MQYAVQETPVALLDYSAKGDTADIRKASVYLRRNYIGWYDCSDGHVHDFYMTKATNHIDGYFNRRYWKSRYQHCGFPTAPEITESLSQIVSQDYWSAFSGFRGDYIAPRVLIVTPSETWSISPNAAMMRLWIDNPKRREVIRQAVECILDAYQWMYMRDTVNETTYKHMLKCLDPALAMSVYERYPGAVDYSTRRETDPLALQTFWELQPHLHELFEHGPGFDVRLIEMLDGAVKLPAGEQPDELVLERRLRSYSRYQYYS